MRDKNGVKLRNSITTCADGAGCICHSTRLCSVCKDIGCKIRYER